MYCHLPGQGGEGYQALKSDVFKIIPHCWIMGEALGAEVSLNRIYS